jgi:seryl-tRNA synthetase
MIDRALLLEASEETTARYARRGVSAASVLEAQNALKERRLAIREVEGLRAELGRRSDEVGEMFKKGRRAEAEAVRASVGELKAKLATEEEKLRAAEERVEYLMLRLPNLPSDQAPEGTDSESNVVVRTHGYDPAAFAGKEFRPHWEIGESLGILDLERASKLSGSMFALFRGDGSRLLRALIHLGIDLNRDRYEEVSPPHFVRTDVFTGTGHLPKFAEDAYRLKDDDLWAIPTGEVPLMGIHRDEILAEADLPRRYLAYTVCFRRESGSAGKDTRGLQRLHEFHKVELLKLCTPESIKEEYAAMLADAERPLQLLGLPYRVVDLCAGDLTFASERIFDLEVYAPGTRKWLEVSSVGSFTDFQARRGNIRYRSKSGEVRFVHALNGSALATPRVWAAVIEHGQQPDGSVRLPDALVKYFGSDHIPAPK